jgi:hypothetical protein
VDSERSQVGRRGLKGGQLGGRVGSAVDLVGRLLGRGFVVEFFFEGTIVRLVSGDVVISETMSLEKGIEMKEPSICLAFVVFLWSLAAWYLSCGPSYGRRQGPIGKVGRSTSNTHQTIILFLFVLVTSKKNIVTL